MKRYYDCARPTIRGSAFACIYVGKEDIETVPAGTTVSAMTRQDDNEAYRRYADLHDLHFLFDDDLPLVDFYAVPRLDLFARDSAGGFFATYGMATGLDAQAPVCYVTAARECWRIAETLRQFIGRVDAGEPWRAHMARMDGITLYASRQDAASALDFIDV